MRRPIRSRALDALRPLVTATLAVAALLPGARALAAQDEAPYTAERNATVPARGARRLQVEGHAGALRVRGVEGLDEVRVRGIARASRRASLDEIRLVARREGDVVVVRAEIPDLQGGDWDGGSSVRALDLVLEVPRGMAAEVTDGSGELEIRGVGALVLHDGSGEIEVSDVASARITDGSGELRVRDVRGDLHVHDGSGDIDVAAVRGTVTVERAGSGGVQVRDVGGDFVLEEGRERNVSHSGVRGRVSVPADDRDRRRARRSWREG